MKLWMVSASGWGMTYNIIRAPNREAAIKAARCESTPDYRVVVEELGDHEGILWSHEEEPVTPADND